jgi:hypothetical protein
MLTAGADTVFRDADFLYGEAIRLLAAGDI